MAAINKNGPSKPPIPNIPPITITNGANTNKPASPTNNNNTIHITPTTQTTRTTLNTSKPTITTGFVQNNNNNKSTQIRIIPPPPPPGLTNMPSLAKVIISNTIQTPMVNKPMIITKHKNFKIEYQTDWVDDGIQLFYNPNDLYLRDWLNANEAVYAYRL